MQADVKISFHEKQLKLLKISLADEEISLDLIENKVKTLKSLLKPTNKESLDLKPEVLSKLYNEKNYIYLDSFLEKVTVLIYIRFQ